MIRRKHLRRISVLAAGMTALWLFPSLALVDPAMAVQSQLGPAFSLTSGGSISVSLSPATGLADFTNSLSASGATNVFTTTTETNVGFASGDWGAIQMECNDDPGQPTFSWPDPYGGVFPPLPVSCHIALAHSIPNSFVVISGNTGYQNGTTCSVLQGTCDSLGNPAAADAVDYPCPPTPIEQSEGDMCAAVVVPLSSSGYIPEGFAIQPLEWSGELEPSLTVTGSGMVSAFPGETLNLTGNDWPTIPIFGGLSGPSTVTTTVSICDPQGCETPTPVSSPAGYATTSMLDVTTTVPATPTNGVIYPCITNCYLEFNASVDISALGLTSVVNVTDSVPISIDNQVSTTTTNTGFTGSTTSTTQPNVTTTIASGSPTTTSPGPGSTPGTSGGYIVTSATGGVDVGGGVQQEGSLVTMRIVPVAPIVASAVTFNNTGYWLVGADRGVFAFGDARYFGSCPQSGSGCTSLVSPIVGMTATPDNKGYWLVGADGGVFAFGDARYFGSCPQSGSRCNALPSPVVGITSDPSGNGYWLALASGVVVLFGNVGALSSVSLNGCTAGTTVPSSMSCTTSTINSFAATQDGDGLWLTTPNGIVYTFGDATFYGDLATTSSPSNNQLSSPIVSIVPTPDDKGYWLVSSSGESFSFGDAPSPAVF